MKPLGPKKPGEVNSHGASLGRHPMLIVNCLLVGLVVIVSVGSFILFPLLFAPSLVSAIALVVLTALITPLHWGLVHETVHSKLLCNEAWNRRAGRLLSILLCLSWEMVRFGHLWHHRANRHDLDRPEAIEPGRSRLGHGASYFFGLLGGSSLRGSLCPLGIMLPMRGTQRALDFMFGASESDETRAAAARVFLDPAKRFVLRLDSVATTALLALAFHNWGVRWQLPAIFLAVRWCVLSLLENAPHYGTPRNSGAYARNTSLPWWARYLILNQNFHGLHHRAPYLPWHELHAAFVRSGLVADGSWVSAVLHQFRGPIVLQ